MIPNPNQAMRANGAGPLVASGMLRSSRLATATATTPDPTMTPLSPKVMARIVRALMNWGKEALPSDLMPVSAEYPNLTHAVEETTLILAIYQMLAACTLFVQEVQALRYQHTCAADSLCPFCLLHNVYDRDEELVRFRLRRVMGKRRIPVYRVLERVLRTFGAAKRSLSIENASQVDPDPRPPCLLLAAEDAEDQAAILRTDALSVQHSDGVTQYKPRAVLMHVNEPFGFFYAATFPQGAAGWTQQPKGRPVVVLMERDSKKQRKLSPRAVEFTPLASAADQKAYVSRTLYDVPEDRAVNGQVSERSLVLSSNQATDVHDDDFAFIDAVGFFRVQFYGWQERRLSLTKATECAQVNPAPAADYFAMAGLPMSPAPQIPFVRKRFDRLETAQTEQSLFAAGKPKIAPLTDDDANDDDQKDQDYKEDEFMPSRKMSPLRLMPPEAPARRPLMVGRHEVHQEVRFQVKELSWAVDHVRMATDTVPEKTWTIRDPCDEAHALCRRLGWCFPDGSPWLSMTRDAAAQFTAMLRGMAVVLRGGLATRTVHGGRVAVVHDLGGDHCHDGGGDSADGGGSGGHECGKMVKKTKKAKKMKKVEVAGEMVIRFTLIPAECNMWRDSSWQLALMTCLYRRGILERAIEQFEVQTQALELFGAMPMLPSELARNRLPGGEDTVHLMVKGVNNRRDSNVPGVLDERLAITAVKVGEVKHKHRCPRGQQLVDVECPGHTAYLVDSLGYLKLKLRKLLKTPRFLTFERRRGRSKRPDGSPKKDIKHTCE